MTALLARRSCSVTVRSARLRCNVGHTPQGVTTPLGWTPKPTFLQAAPSRRPAVRAETFVAGHEMCLFYSVRACSRTAGSKMLVFSWSISRTGAAGDAPHGRATGPAFRRRCGSRVGCVQPATEARRQSWSGPRRTGNALPTIESLSDVSGNWTLPAEGVVSSTMYLVLPFPNEVVGWASRARAHRASGRTRPGHYGRTRRGPVRRRESRRGLCRPIAGLQHARQPDIALDASIRAHRWTTSSGTSPPVRP
jgi:hypothetical protein